MKKDELFAMLREALNDVGSIEKYEPENPIVEYYSVEHPNYPAMKTEDMQGIKTIMDDFRSLYNDNMDSEN